MCSLHAVQDARGNVVPVSMWGEHEQHDAGVVETPVANKSPPASIPEASVTKAAPARPPPPQAATTQESVAKQASQSATANVKLAAVASMKEKETETKQQSAPAANTLPQTHDGLKSLLTTATDSSKLHDYGLHIKVA